MSQAAELPNCDQAFEQGLFLSDAERNRLVSSLMSGGVGGVDDFVRQHSGDGMIGERIRKLRAQLKAQAQGAEQERERAYAELEVKAEQAYRGRIDEVSREEMRLRDSIDSGQTIVSSGLVQLVLDSADRADAAPPERPGFWKRAQEGLRRAWLRFRAALGRFWDWLHGRKRKAKKGDRIMLPSVALGGKSVNLEFAVNKALGDAAFRSNMDRRISKMGSSDRVRVMADDKLYREAVKRLIREDMEKARKKDEKVRKTRAKKAAEQLDELETERERIRQSLQKKKEDLLREKEDKARELERDIERKSAEAVRNELLDQFEGAGYISRDGSGMAVTARLIDRFAEIIYAMEVEGLGSARKRMISGIGGFGEYLRDNMRTVDEVGRIDLLESAVTARMNHPHARGIYDEDVMVNRELKGDQFHVVIMFDKSGSMDENGRLNAAKRATLALFKAVRLHNKKNIIDLVAFDSKVRVMDLVDAWNCKPEGFTNIGEALNVCHGLLRRSRADRKLVYLITDGLPEAYTSGGGEVFIGDTKASMEYAVGSAMRLRKIRDCKLVMIMLEPRQKQYVDAAREIAAAAEGAVLTADPSELAREMLTDYASAVA